MNKLLSLPGRGVVVEKIWIIWAKVTEVYREQNAPGRIQYVIAVHNKYNGPLTGEKGKMGINNKLIKTHVTN